MRFVLIDYMHLAHKSIVCEPLSTTILVDGVAQVVDTTIPAYTIKNIWYLSGKGENSVGVFFEGGNSKRKEYFKILQQADKGGYKGSRNALSTKFKNGVNLTTRLLQNGGVSCFGLPGYEADDMIYSCCQMLKRKYPAVPIDIITGDADMLPLVDDQVSVYLRGNRTFAMKGCPEHRGYFQVTPENWDEALSYRSAFKAFNVPYNAIFLYKMIRGDSADGIPIVIDGFGGVNFTKLMQSMIDVGADFPVDFRYDSPWERMEELLSNFFTDEALRVMKFVGDGLRLADLSTEYELSMPKCPDWGTLSQALSPFKININQ